MADEQEHETTEPAAEPESGGSNSKERPTTVPYDRFAKKVADLKSAQEELAALRARAAAFEEEQAKMTSLQEQIAQDARDREGWDTERQLLRAGLTDDDAQDVARLFWGKLPKDDRPPIGDWIKSLRADPDKAPPALRAYFGGQDAPRPAAGVQGAGGRQDASATASGTTVTAQAWREAEARKDWARVAELRALDKRKG